MKKLNVPQFISPEKVLHEIGLDAGMSVVDYASGAGHWSLSAAKIVGPKGRVLALENDINMLNLLRSRAEVQKLSNIEIEEIELEKGVSKEAKPSDVVIVSNILHLIDNKGLFAKKASELLVPGGKLVLVDWIARKTLFGPPIELRVREEDAISIFEGVGLTLGSALVTGLDHFGIIFQNGEATHEE